ncbi:Lysine/ornithine decarboxylase [compost metagenome]
MVTQKVLNFLADYREDGPVLVVDLNTVRENFKRFRESLPDSKIYYAIKANPDPKILQMLADSGSSFDCASVPEIRMALAAGASPDRISYGNTIKKERDIKTAYGLGIRLFAVDSIEEVMKLVMVAPDAKVFCRILTDGDGADWPLSRKFGCTPDMAVSVLREAHTYGLTAYGVSFHVGSQMTKVTGWDLAIAEAKQIFDRLAADGINLKLVNMGGGFPTRYLKDVPSTIEFGKAIKESLVRYFGNDIPETIIEPGRGMVGNAGVIRTEVILIAKKSDDDTHRWVFLDIGKFSGLAETMEEAIRYPIFSLRDEDNKAPCVLAGPTCDSADVLYEKRMYELPETLEIGDFLYIDSAGVYTTTYSTVAFNGFEPLRSFVID